ncbi:MAG: AAA family ATPase, partial [Candidatus Methanoperedens sp.]|nr:AAA family ATPase [Candidatus Methanoperedens sp.]
MIIALTGTPGTGKTTVCGIMKEHSQYRKMFHIIDLNKLIIDEKLYTGKDVERDTYEADIDKLEERVLQLINQAPQEKDVILEGHLSYFLPVDSVIVLRVNPVALRKRLGARNKYSILGGGTQFSLGNLKAGDEASITFNLAVDIAARPGVYNLPLRITGLNNYSSDNYAGVVVAGSTDFEISYQETLGSFSLNVANIGVNPASAVTVSLPRQKNFSSTGSSSSVLGNLNPGDYTSALFQIAKISGTGNIAGTIPASAEKVAPGEIPGGVH